jgi:hypothetical protein
MFFDSDLKFFVSHVALCVDSTTDILVEQNTEGECLKDWSIDQSVSWNDSLKRSNKLASEKLLWVGGLDLLEPERTSFAECRQPTGELLQFMSVEHRLTTVHVKGSKEAEQHFDKHPLKDANFAVSFLGAPSPLPNAFSVEMLCAPTLCQAPYD